MSSVKNSAMRSSNFELLRLICMLMIAIHHFIMQPFHGELPLSTHGYDWLLMNDLCYIGVNCFILISGWFGIRTSWKGIWQLFFFCAFYGLASYLFHIWHTGAHIGSSVLGICLLPFSHSQWWFINCYLILYLAAPLINKAIESISKTQYLTILILFTIMNVYFGNMMHTPFFNTDGYSAAQFIYIYLIGGYLRRYIDFSNLQSHRWLWLLGYFVSALCYFGIHVLSAHHDMTLLHLGYNNIFNIAAATCFFLFVASFQFQSRVVNYLSASALAVYLIQESIYFGHGWLYQYVGGRDYNLAQILLLSVCFMFACICFDQIRRVIAIPLNKCVSKAVNIFPDCIKEIERKS